MRRLLVPAILALLFPLLGVPASAEASTTATRAVGQDPDVKLTRFRFDDAVMDHANFDGISYLTKITGVVGTKFSSGSGYQPVANAVTTGLRVNGKAPNDSAFTNIGWQFLDGGKQRVGTFVPINLGPGKYVVGPLNLAIRTDSGDRDVKFQVRDTFFVRQPTVAKLRAQRNGSQVTLRITAQVRSWKTWKLKRVSPRARVERLVGGGWQLLAMVPLSRAGKAVRVINAAAPLRYRVRIAQTPTKVGRVAATGRV